MSLVHTLENVMKERDELRAALDDAYEEVRMRDMRIAELESITAGIRAASVEDTSMQLSENASSDVITNDEVTSTLHRLANNEAVDERLGVPPAEMARMVDANARFRASMGPLSVGEMLSLRDEFQSAFDSIGGGPIGAGASSTSALVEQVRAAMPPSAQVYAFSDATYVVEPSTNTGIAVRSGSSGVSFSLHLDGAIHDALALAKECIESAKTAEKERDTAVRRHKKLKDAFNAKVAEKAGYYKQYAKLVREF